MECFKSNSVFSRSCLCLSDIVSTREEAEEGSVVVMSDAIFCDWAKMFFHFICLAVLSAVSCKADAMSVTSFSFILSSTAIACPYPKSIVRHLTFPKHQAFCDVLSICHYSFSFCFSSIDCYLLLLSFQCLNHTVVILPILSAALLSSLCVPDMRWCYLKNGHES